jgi:4'-phosphopantetheinyl transferase EntD
MTFPVFMAEDGIGMAAERQLPEQSRLNTQVIEEIDALQGAIDRRIPIRPGMTILAGPVIDAVEALYAEEKSLIEKAIDRRQWEFATARTMARTAMNELGLASAPILKGAQREPLWPRGVVGSLTHAEACAAVCVARAEAVKSVGLDIEVAERVGKDLYGKLFTPAEREYLAGQDPRMAGLLFSAKEAVYKAVFPLVGRFIGFQEAELTVDDANGRIRFRYMGDHPPNSVMERAECWYLFSEPYVLSLVVIP